MKIGVPRERKQGESRIAITPAGAKRLVDQGHSLLIESGSGINSGFTDDDYLNAGALLSNSIAEVWNKSELVVKVKEPSDEETPFFRDDLALFCFLHHAAFPQLTDAMLKSGITGIDYDLVTLADGSLPILKPMSIVAGKLSIQCGALCLQSNMGGNGILLGGTNSVSPGRVLIIGAGAAGASAASVAVGMGATVVILDINQKRLDDLPKSQQLIPLLSNNETIISEISKADLTIGSVLIPGDKAPKLITKDMLKSMKPGSAIVDICIDQGGCAETSRPTSIAKPTYLEGGIIHYCVPNMPALVPHTATKALTNETIGYIEILANAGINQALSNSSELLPALTTYKGNLTNEIIGQALDLKSLDPKKTKELLLSK